MAASGINEHHEACRKQNVINRQAFNKKHCVDKMLGVNQEVPASSRNIQEMTRASNGHPCHLGEVNSYDMEKFHKQHCAVGTDRERRKAVRQEQYLTYSAKINGRLSSRDYVQQW